MCGSCSRACNIADSTLSWHRMSLQLQEYTHNHRSTQAIHPPTQHTCRPATQLQSAEAQVGFPIPCGVLEACPGRVLAPLGIRGMCHGLQ
eukprot:4608447-Amphidinium_carterae.1